MSTQRALLLVVTALLLAVLACSPFGGGESTPEPPAVDASGAGEQGAGDAAAIPPPPPKEISSADIPVYPGAERSASEEAEWVWIDVRTDTPFGGDTRVYSTPDPMPDVLSFYDATLPQFGWTRSFEAFGDSGGLVVWTQTTAAGSYELGVAVRSYDQSGVQAPTTLALMLKTLGSSGQDQAQATQPPQGTDVTGALVTPAPDGSTMPPAGEGLLTTAALSMGLDSWNQWLQGGSSVPGNNSVEMVDDQMMYRVVEFTRSEGGRDGGAAGITQQPNLDVSGYPHLYVWLVGKVLYEEGGNIANSSPAWFPEGAVQVRVKYIGQSGQQREWYHGFYSGRVSGADAVHFTQVPQGEWFRYNADLMAQPDPPVRITDLQVYGFGWEFRGQVAEVNLIGAMQ